MLQASLHHFVRHSPVLLFLVVLLVLVKNAFHVFEQVRGLEGVALEQLVHYDEHCFHFSYFVVDDCPLLGLGNDADQQLAVDFWDFPDESVVKPVAKVGVDVLSIGFQQRHYNLEELLDDDDDFLEGGLLGGEPLLGRPDVFPVDEKVADILEESGLGQFELVLVAGDLRYLVEEVDDLEW